MRAIFLLSLISLLSAGHPVAANPADIAARDARREVIRLEMEVERLSQALMATDATLAAAQKAAEDSSIAMVKAIEAEPSLEAVRAKVSEAEAQMVAAVQSKDPIARAKATGAVQKATEVMYEQAYVIPAIAALRDASTTAGKNLKLAREAAVAATSDGKPIVDQLVAARKASGQ